MNDKQPEALRLADLIERYNSGVHSQAIVEDYCKAAAELRRLHIVEKAFQQWITKTEWVQKSSKSHELGMHRADVMKQRIDRLRDENEALRAALEQSQGEQEPVAWQYRMRPDWGIKKDCWGPWQDCTREQAAMYQRVKLLHDWVYETRQLYTHPQPKRDASGKPDEWFDRLKAAHNK